MPTSSDLLYIIKRLEQFQAELLMEGRDSDLTESITCALNELYWAYKDMSVYEVDEDER